MPRLPLVAAKRHVTNCGHAMFPVREMLEQAREDMEVVQPGLGPYCDDSYGWMLKFT
jgi:hypothetical protein